MGLFVLKLDRARIKKRHEFLNPAEVKFYSFINDGRLSLPGLDQLLSTSDPQTVRQTIRDMAKHVLNQWETPMIQNVQRGHIFSFGDTGRILFRSNVIPEYLDWIMMVIEVDQDVRNLGARIEEILPDAQVDSLATNIMTVASIAGGPQAVAATALAKALVKGVTYFLKNNENDQIGYVEQSFVRGLDYPQGQHSAAGVADLTNNMWYDYTIFGTEEV